MSYRIIEVCKDFELNLVRNEEEKCDAINTAEDRIYYCKKYNIEEVKVVFVYDNENNEIIYWRKIAPINVSRETNTALTLKCLEEKYTKKIRFLMYIWNSEKISENVIETTLNDMLSIHDISEELFTNLLDKRIKAEAERIFNKI